MIFFLDRHPTKCANAVAIDHLRATFLEGVLRLCDASRVLIEECNIAALERKMRDVKAEVKSSSYYDALERDVPLPKGDLEHPLVKWAVDGPDAFDWLLEFTTDVGNEIREWTGRGLDGEHGRMLNWVRVNSPRPMHVGRVQPRRSPFPILTSIPFEYTTMLRPLRIEGDREEVSHVEWTYRCYYWAKYRHTVQYAKMRKPWWWSTLEVHALASPGATG